MLDFEEMYKRKEALISEREDWEEENPDGDWEDEFPSERDELAELEQVESEIGELWELWRNSPYVVYPHDFEDWCIDYAIDTGMIDREFNLRYFDSETFADDMKSGFTTVSFEGRDYMVFTDY